MCIISVFNDQRSCQGIWDQGGYKELGLQITGVMVTIVIKVTLRGLGFRCILLLLWQPITLRLIRGQQLGLPQGNYLRGQKLGLHLLQRMHSHTQISLCFVCCHHQQFLQVCVLFILNFIQSSSYEIFTHIAKSIEQSTCIILGIYNKYFRMTYARSIKLDQAYTTNISE